MAEQRTVIIVGAGAAGLMAAVAAARKGAKVTVLEAMERPGRKLLLTGNGRCNLTNMAEDLPESYYGSGADTAKALIRKMDAASTRTLFAELGLLTQEKNGYVYPYTGQSGSVLEVLLAELRRWKVKLKLNEKIVGLEKTEEDGWLVKTAAWQYTGDAVILACGSCAVPTTGSDGSGYTLAKELGHRIIPAAPALVPVICQEAYLPQLAGVRCKASVSLLQKKDGSILKTEKGELQWTRYGVSGIVVFQLSRFISAAPEKAPYELQLDLLPDFNEQQLQHMLLARAAAVPNEKLLALLGGFLPDKLIPVLLEIADQRISGVHTAPEQKQNTKKGRNSSRKGGFSSLLCGSLTKDHASMLIHLMKKWTLTVTGTKSFDTAQVCAGGIVGTDLNPDTLESLLHRGLYFAGELIDVDGPCGGYNLQWAWSSGWTAGSAAAQLSESNN